MTAASPAPSCCPTQSFGPATFELMGGIKSGRFYLLNRASMGKFCASCDDSQAIGILDTGFGIFDAPAFAFGMVYIGGVGPGSRPGRSSTDACPRGRSRAPRPLSAIPAPPPRFQRRQLHRIVWALDMSGFGNREAGGPARLLVQSGGDLQQRSGVGLARHRGPAVKFTVPTVANGKVYVGTQTEAPRLTGCCLSRSSALAFDDREDRRIVNNPRQPQSCTLV